MSTNLNLLKGRLAEHLIQDLFLHADYPYKNAWFVIVSPFRIQCMHYKRLSAGYAITATSKYALASVRSFHISADLIREYEGYASQLFAGFEKNVM